MQKILAKLLVFLMIFQIISPIGFIGQVFAVSNTWDFNSSANYTLSDTDVNHIRIENSLVRLPYHLEHLWAVQDSTLLDQARRVVVKWNYAFVSAYNNDSVESIDISDPTNPILVNTISDWDWGMSLDGPIGLAFTWNYLYVAWYLSDNVNVIDISDPTNMSFVREIDKWSWFNTAKLKWAKDVKVYWDYLYVTSYKDDAFNVYDNSDPSNPSYKKNIQDHTKLDWANRSEISWTYAYVSVNRNDSFEVIDLSNQDSSFQNISIVWEVNNGDNWALLDWARWLSLSWNIAYVSSNVSDALELIDINDPTNPVHTWSISNWTPVKLNANRQNVLYNWFSFNSARSSDAIEVVNIKDPTNPIHESELSKSATILLNWTNDIYNSWSLFFSAWNVDDSLEIMKAKYSTNSPYIIPNTPYNYTWSINSFSEVLWANNQWNITYQISYDNWNNWYWFNWSKWQLTNSWVIDSNSASVINSNLYWFNQLNIAWTWSFLFKAFLNSDWTQKVELDSVNIKTIESPTEIVNPVFWYDGQDTDWDWDSTNEPNAWSEVSPFTDKFNWYNAYNNTGWTIPTYNTWAINNHPNLNFDWSNDYYNIDNQTEINTASSYYEKSFALVFKTSDDINTFQNIYEQWWTARWYNIQIENGHLYAWVFNNKEWASWDQYKFVDLWVINPNQTYYLTMIQESTNSKTLKVYLDSNLIASLSNVDYQRAHWWSIWLWYINWNTVKASDNSSTNWPAYFKWNIGEFISWNHALTGTERQWIDMYLKNKWWLSFQIYPIITWSNINDYDLFKTSNGLKLEFYYKDWLWWNWIDSNSALLSLKRLDSWNFWADLSWSLIDSGLTNITTSTWTYYATWNWLQWEYEANFSIWNVDWNSVNKKVYFYIDPLWIPWKVLDIDLEDPKANAWTSFPQSWTWLSLVKDKFYWYDAYQATTGSQAIFYSSWIINPNNPWVVFDWVDDEYNIDNQYDLNTAPKYDEKSFSIVFKTSDDINTFQNIYEQWGWSRWYAIQVQSWTLYVWAWNNVEWQSWDQYKTLTWTLQPNTVYNVSMVQNSVDSNIANNTFDVYIDGQLIWTLNNIDYQRAHAWSISIWEIRWWAVRLSDNNTNPWDWHYFKWSLWELISWNHALTATDLSIVNDYLRKKWDLDKVAPIILSGSIASGSLLPWANHNISFSYSDSSEYWTWVWINTNSWVLNLEKWNSSNSSWTDVSNLVWSWILTQTWASYDLNNLDYWKYKAIFNIADNNWNISANYLTTFYIDEPQLIISTWSINIWKLNSNTNTFWNTLTVTVKTVWAWFRVKLKKNKALTHTNNSDFIPYYNWSLWMWYDKNNDWNLSDYNDDIILSDSWTLNTNWDLNIYTYTLKIWAIIDKLQAAGNYSWKIDFGIDLDY